VTPGPNGEEPAVTPDPAAPGAPASPADPAPDPTAQPADAPTVEMAAGTSETPEPPGTPAVPAAEPARPTLFQDRPLTELEQKRLDVARVQPKPWEPSDDLLDPTSDTGWESAASHELIAIRPEDVLTPESQPFVPPSPQLPAVAPAGPVAAGVPAAVAAGQASSALTWASAGAGVATTTAATTTSPFVASAGPASAPFAPAAVVPIGAAPGQPPPEVALAPSERRWRRATRGTRTRLAVAAQPLVIAGLFLIGVAMGLAVFARGQSAALLPQQNPAQAVAANEGTTETVPPQILSLIDALRSDNQTAVQLVVPAQPYRTLAGELASDGISRIIGARALYTYAIGNDSATEILVTGVDQTGSALTFNLVVHLKDGAITEFR
jgi:hypothetical protein